MGIVNSAVSSHAGRRWPRTTQESLSRSTNSASSAVLTNDALSSWWNTGAVAVGSSFAASFSTFPIVTASSGVSDSGHK